MDIQAFAELARTFGSPGLFVAFLLYDRQMQAKRLEKLDDLTEKRTAADIEVAKSLALLTAVIEGMKR